MDLSDITEIYKLLAKDKIKDKRVKHKCESVIASDLDFALRYAREVLHGRFELAEPLFAKSAFHSLHYSSNILERFELGEPIISTSARYSYLYAYTVLDNRFELGEDVIARNAMYSYKYAKNVICGPFKLGEATLKDEAEWLCSYLMNVPNTYQTDLIMTLLNTDYRLLYITHFLRPSNKSLI